MGTEKVKDERGDTVEMYNAEERRKTAERFLRCVRVEFETVTCANRYCMLEEDGSFERLTFEQLSELLRDEKVCVENVLGIDENGGVLDRPIAVMRQSREELWHKRLHELNVPLGGYSDELVCKAENGGVRLVAYRPAKRRRRLVLPPFINSVEWGVFEKSHGLEELVFTAPLYGDVSGMFFRSDVEKLRIVNMDMRFVTELRSMFLLCTKLKSVEFVTETTAPNLLSVMSMFYGCTALERLDLSKITDCGNVTDKSGMFEACRSLAAANFAGGELGSPTNIADCRDMFFESGQLTQQKGVQLAAGKTGINSVPADAFLR